jgi:hypothetical protein
MSDDVFNIVKELRTNQCPPTKECNKSIKYCQCMLMRLAANEIDRLQDRLSRIDGSYDIMFSAVDEIKKQCANSIRKIRKMKEK